MTSNLIDNKEMALIHYIMIGKGGGGGWALFSTSFAIERATVVHLCCVTGGRRIFL